MTKGIVSEKVNTMDMDNIAESQHPYCGFSFSKIPDLRDTLLPLMNNIRSAQGAPELSDYMSSRLRILGLPSANEIEIKSSKFLN